MMRHTPRTLAVAFTPIALALALFTLAEPVGGHGGWRDPDWSPPLNLGPNVNSPFEDLAPHLSSDGLALYFTSTRPGSLGGEDLWVTTRASSHDEWGPAANLGAAINTAANERSPALSRNRRLLFFATDRPGGSGGFDIWLSWRADPNDEAGWQPPVNLGTGINTAATDAGPSFFEGVSVGHGHHDWWRPVMPLLFMASNRPGGPGGLDLYLSSVPGGWAGAPTAILELNSPQNDLTPTVRRDGLEIIIASNRPGTAGNFDLWQSFRRSVHDRWSTPVNLGPVINTDSGELFPSLSFDGRTLLFQSFRPGGFGGTDLYMTTR